MNRSLTLIISLFAFTVTVTLQMNFQKLSYGSVQILLAWMEKMTEDSDETYIDSIFPNCSDVATCISQAANSIGLNETPRYEANIDEQDDWIKNYQESFHPVEVTNGLWVVPEWKTPPFGAALSVGVDIDPHAIETAHLNAALNNIGSDKMELYLVPGSTDENGTVVGKKQSLFETGLLPETEKYDVIIANILLNPLLELAVHIVSYAKPGAIVGLSGILSEQVLQIIDSYSKLLEDISISKMDDWAIVIGKKKRSF